MSTATKKYSQKVSVTETQQTITLPRLSYIELINVGNYDAFFEFENDIDANSTVLLVRSSAKYPADFIDVRLKCAAGQTATVYLTGLKHFKS